MHHRLDLELQVFDREVKSKSIPIHVEFKFDSSSQALASWFEFCKTIRDILIEKTSNRNYSKGNLGGFINDFMRIKEVVEEEFKLQLASPFEGCDTIWGGIWRGKELLNRSEYDAIIELKFEPDSRDLPSHVHSVSDRVLIVIDGEGFFHPNFMPYEEFDSNNNHKVPIVKGDVLFFPKNFVHTFSSESKGMHMLSYHLPFIELEDPLQYTITKNVWHPKDHL